MTSDIASTLARLGEKSRFLTERFKVVQRERDDALLKITDLEKELHDCKRKIQRMQTELEYLKISSVLAPTAESVVATRGIIRELIAEIDKCISELKD